MQQGVITLLDILGWKGVWQRQGDDEPIKNLESILFFTQALCDALNERHNENHPEAGAHFEAISISDTIAIVGYPIASENLPGGVMISEHAALAAHIVRHSLTHSIPMRGAISIGKFSVKGNVFIGPAVDEVASWYEAADWIGVNVTPSIMLQREKLKQVKSSFLLSAGKSMPMLDHLVDYQVPLKGRPAQLLERVMHSCAKFGDASSKWLSERCVG